MERVSIGWGAWGPGATRARAVLVGRAMSLDPSLRPHSAVPYPLEKPTVVDLATRHGHRDLSALGSDGVIDLTEHVDDFVYDPLAAEPDLQIAVLIPCHNEAITIADVVRDFRRSLPTAAIYVYDNASTDRTAEIAAAAGAIVRRAPSLGKGNVLRRMFSEVEATVYVLADGDGTYDASAAPVLIERLRSHHLEMVVGRRVEIDTSGVAYRRGHQLGNRVLTASVQLVVRRGLRRHALGLPGPVAPVREVVPGRVRGLRGRDRDDDPRARPAALVRGDPDRLPRAAGRVQEQAAHDSRRAPHRPVHAGALQGVPPAAVLRRAGRAVPHGRPRRPVPAATCFPPGRRSRVSASRSVASPRCSSLPVSSSTP